jgi:hypothetical protein
MTIDAALSYSELAVMFTKAGGMEADSCGIKLLLSRH